MFEEINNDYIETHDFKDNCSEYAAVTVKEAYRFSKGDIIPPSDEEKIIQLRKKLGDLLYIKYYHNNSKFESCCDTNIDNVRKFINNRRKNISRNVLGKVCVGSGVSVEEAQELFTLQGFALDPQNKRFDAIVVCCLKHHDDIYEMVDMCKKYNISLDHVS